MWKRELEQNAAAQTSGCRLRRTAQVPLAAQFASGLTGYTQAHGVAGEIQKLYFQGPNSTFYWQVLYASIVNCYCT